MDLQNAVLFEALVLAVTAFLSHNFSYAFIMLHTRTGTADIGVTKDASSTLVLGTKIIKTADKTVLARSSHRRSEDIYQGSRGRHVSLASSSLHPRSQKWNSTIRNICRLMTVFFTFIMLGLNDAVLGVSYDCSRYTSSTLTVDNRLFYHM